MNIFDAAYCPSCGALQPVEEILECPCGKTVCSSCDGYYEGICSECYEALPQKAKEQIKEWERLDELWIAKHPKGEELDPMTLREFIWDELEKLGRVVPEKLG